LNIALIAQTGALLLIGWHTLQVHDYAAIACTLLHAHTAKRALTGPSPSVPAKRQSRSVTSSYLVNNQ